MRGKDVNAATAMTNLANAPHGTIANLSPDVDLERD